MQQILKILKVVLIRREIMKRHGIFLVTTNKIIISYYLAEILFKNVYIKINK